MKPTTISIMGSYTSGNMFISSCLLWKNFIYSNLIWSSVLVCEFATHGQISSSVWWQNLFQAICLEAFVVTIFNRNFSGRQPHQIVKMFHSFRHWLFLCWEEEEEEEVVVIVVAVVVPVVAIVIAVVSVVVLVVVMMVVVVVQGQSLKHWNFLTHWCGCLPDKILLNCFKFFPC